ncbi:MbtH family protein [Streptomyces tendae]|uniref:MbtH family protein n=1 Tax=Streptomyces tendae TaxID=1932 RepID=UPI003D73654B
MMNPFEDSEGPFHVLINNEGQYSLWPSFVEIPAGWVVALKEDSREACIAYIEKEWVDMRPKTLTVQRPTG